ncbi:MAG TPA: ABC transporter permease [Mycobacteriales bacterium]|nr:ABC transporter permease [Mycobacteriales bacterium]
MGRYVLRRVLYMIPTLFLISIVAFLIIQLPPGDFLTAYIATLTKSGQSVQPEVVQSLKNRYGLDQSIVVQYWKWISNIVFHLDFGQSFEYNKPVASLFAERLPLTLALGGCTLLLSWAIALPAGIYSAVRKYSIGDYLITTLCLLGVAIPGFLIALVIAYFQFDVLNWSVGGMLSPQFTQAQWNLGKLLDWLRHFILPVLIIGLEGTIGTIRILRANLLDELHKPYVVTARSKGLSERRLLAKYPVRLALNPFVSTIGWVLPGLINGEVIVSSVLGLNTTGPLLLNGLQAQDMYLAGSIILVLSALTVLGTLISDIALAALDPRIRERYA